VRPRVGARALERQAVRARGCAQALLAPHAQRGLLPFALAAADAFARPRPPRPRSASGVGCALGEEGIRAFTLPKALHLLRPA
jgi:hypothetical protein